MENQATPFVYNERRRQQEQIQKTRENPFGLNRRKTTEFTGLRTWPVNDPKPGEIFMKSENTEKFIETKYPDWKDANPKDAFGDKKLPLDVVPSVVQEYAALGFLEGALKYGRFNYRVKGVKVSTYIAALRRHIDKYMEGEWADEKTRVPHLANALACIGIILDADRCRKLTDDRPPSLPNHSEWIDAQSDIVEHLKTLYKDVRPRHYTISDTEKPTLAFNAEDSCPKQ